MIFHPHPQGVPYWRLSGFYFLFFVTVGIFLPYWSLYLKSIGMNAEQIGILSAIVVFTKIFVTYLWGWIVDHTGRRIRVIRIASICSAVSFSVALYVQSFWGLAIVLFIFSLFWSASLPQIEAATLAHLGEKTHIYTNIRVWGSVGFIITVWLLGMVFEFIDISNVPWLMLLSMIIVWLMSLLIPEQAVVHHEDGSPGIRSILFRPQVLAFFAVCFLMLAGHGPYYTFYSIYLEEHGYSSTFIGQMWSLGVIAEVILFMLMQHLSRFASLRNLLLASLIFAVIRWLLIGYFVESLVLLVVAQIFHAATFGIYHAVAILYVHRFFRGRLQGRGQALYSSVGFGAGMAFGSLASGYAWERFGALFSFQAAAAVSMLAFILVWIWIRE
jgi:PPP family 3-phenylpropionic acid transporter